MSPDEHHTLPPIDNLSTKFSADRKYSHFLKIKTSFMSMGMNSE